MVDEMGDRRPARLGAALGAWLCAALCAALGASLASCAGKPPAPLISPEPRIEASIILGEPRFQDQHRLVQSFSLVLRNPASEERRLLSAAASLEIQGGSPIAARLASGAALATLAPGESLSLAFEAPIDVRELDEELRGPEGPARAAFACEARAVLAAAGDEEHAARATAEGSFPIVREPRLRISSLRIERDILVTTNLRLELEIENPNDFPLDFGHFDYRFFGEGKGWADGSYDRGIALPARSRQKAYLAFEMNFADRDRRLFDLVAQLKTVRYALKGKARVATGLPFLPEFGLEVDEEGSCLVER